MRKVRQKEALTKSTPSNFISAALISLILVLPFAILEALHHPITQQNAVGLLCLFGLLWLLPTIFILILVPIPRTVPAGDGAPVSRLNLLFRVAFLVLIAMLWGGLVIDQIPCFLGVANCD